MFIRAVPLGIENANSGFVYMCLCQRAHIYVFMYLFTLVHEYKLALLLTVMSSLTVSETQFTETGCIIRSSLTSNGLKI